MRVEQLNLALDAVVYNLIKCRTLNLTKFTTTNKPTWEMPRVRVETHASFFLDYTQYDSKIDGGFKLSDQTYRRIRQEIRQMFSKLDVAPNWGQALSTGDVKTPCNVYTGTPGCLSYSQTWKYCIYEGYL